VGFRYLKAPTQNPYPNTQKIPYPYPKPIPEYSKNPIPIPKTHTQILKKSHTHTQNPNPNTQKIPYPHPNPSHTKYSFNLTGYGLGKNYIQ